MFSVYTTTFANLRKQGTAGLETNILWRQAGLGDCLSAIYSGCSRFRQEANPIARGSEERKETPSEGITLMSVQ